MAIKPKLPKGFPHRSTNDPLTAAMIKGKTPTSPKAKTKKRAAK